MITILVIVHVTLAAVVFGAPLGAVSAAKRALAVNPEAFKLAASEVDRRGKLTSISAILLLLSGVGLILAYGGFGVVSKNFHIALTVMLAAIAFSFAWMKPNSAKLLAAAEAQPTDKDAAQVALKKLAMGSGILHAIWLVLLVLMYFRF